MTKVPEPYIGAAYDSLVTVIKRAGKDKQGFIDDLTLQDATLMRLMDAGEHLSHVRDGYPEYYESHASPAWNSLVGLRNIIAHGYLQIDRDKVWDIVQNELPDLVAELKVLIKKLNFLVSNSFVLTRGL